jgi:hypothetical protein
LGDKKERGGEVREGIAWGKKIFGNVYLGIILDAHYFREWTGILTLSLSKTKIDIKEVIIITALELGSNLGLVHIKSKMSKYYCYFIFPYYNGFEFERGERQVQAEELS